ncbi:MAG: glycosyltransferase [Anaerolineales bacterium]|nr:glycosyltransferase [Anaerolineales bacterium]
MLMKRFTIIIPDSDSLRMGAILAALREQSADLSAGEVLVVGSDRPGLVQSDELVRLIPSDEGNSCASDRRNLGMRAALGEIFLFLDDDCIPRRDWLERHLSRQAAGEQVVGGSVELASRNYLQLADNLSAFHFMMPYTRPGYRPYLCSANLSVQRSVVAQVGEMAPHKNRADDLEWTTRFRMYGYRLYFEPQAVALHDPQRCSLAAVCRHWLVDAPETLRVRLRYADLLGTPRLARRRAMYLWGAPVTAAWATGRAFSHWQTIRSYGHTLPLVYLTKLLWCWSAYRHFPAALDDPVAGV